MFLAKISAIGEGNRYSESGKAEPPGKSKNENKSKNESENEKEIKTESETESENESENKSENENENESKNACKIKDKNMKNLLANKKIYLAMMGHHSAVNHTQQDKLHDVN